MNNWISMVGLVGLFIFVLGIFAIIKHIKEKEIRKKYPGYPKGYWMNQGIGTGIAIGAGIGVALDSLAIRIGIGIAIGTSIGSGLEKKHKDEIRPLVKEEEELKKQTTFFILGTLILGIVGFLFVFFVVK
jgi:hypothetical protein